MSAETAAGRWESVLDSVVVYASGALCRRHARGTVPADGRVRLTGLPRVADASSLRASVLSGGARVTSVRLESEAELRDRADLPELQRRVERARDVVDAARGRAARQDSRIAEIAGVRAVPPAPQSDEPHRRVPADAWLELADFVDERLTALHARAALLAEEVRLAEHALAVAIDALARASTADRAEPTALTRTALVTLDGVPDGAEVGLELEYGVPGAVWVPTYRLTYRQGDDSGTLLLRAQLAQRTGEDWTGVRVGLSTADLHRRTDLPKLRSLRIGRRQPVPAPPGWREPPAGCATSSPGTTRRAARRSRSSAARGGRSPRHRGRAAPDGRAAAARWAAGPRARAATGRSARRCPSRSRLPPRPVRRSRWRPPWRPPCRRRRVRPPRRRTVRRRPRPRCAPAGRPRRSTAARRSAPRRTPCRRCCRRPARRSPSWTTRACC